MLKDKKLICIIGRTGSGKDTVAKWLQKEKKLKPVVSYTTRPKRENETDGVEHYFISEDEFTELMNTKEIAAYTKIEDPSKGVKGYECCATTEEVLNSDIYLIDPIGLKRLKDWLADKDITLIELYISVPEEIRRQRIIDSGRGEKALEEFEIRNANEDLQFREYEEENNDFSYGTVNDGIHYWISNNDGLDDLIFKVKLVYTRIKFE